MANWKDKLHNIKTKFNFDDKEAANAFSFVAEVIALEQERMEADEPYATNAIRFCQQAEQELNDINSFTESLNAD